MIFINKFFEEQSLDAFRNLLKLYLTGLSKASNSTKYVEFALNLEDKDLRSLARHVTEFNTSNVVLKLSFAYDAFNHRFGIKGTYPMWAKENMLRGYMTSLEQGINLYHLLRSVIASNVPGEVVELGCYKGTTAALLQKTLDEQGCDKELHLYDSFDGLPPATDEDRGGLKFSSGAMKVSPADVIDTFTRFGCKLPVLHQGWFIDTLPGRLPPKISFAHLDGDLYESIKVSLINIYSRLTQGAIVVIDDYYDPDMPLTGKDLFPGVKIACDEFFADKPEKVQSLLAGVECHGFFIKK